MKTLSAAKDKSTTRLVGSLAAFLVGAAVLFTRFPPADLSGWLATTTGTTLGVPYLFAALFFLATIALLRRTGRWKPLMILAITLSAISGVVGILLIAATP